MSVFDEPLPCGGTYDCEGCQHEQDGACTILMEQILVGGEQ